MDLEHKEYGSIYYTIGYAPIGGINDRGVSSFDTSHC